MNGIAVSYNAFPFFAEAVAACADGVSAGHNEDNSSAEAVATSYNEVASCADGVSAGHNGLASFAEAVAAA